MSYGNVSISSDIRSLKAAGHPKTRIVDRLSKKIRDRYPDIPAVRARRIVSKIYEGKETTLADWSIKPRRK